jgi:CBS domain-containing protein
VLVKDIMQKRLHIAGKDISVKQAVAIMNKFEIGALLIGSKEKLYGIFSERDLMLRVIVPELSIENTLIADVMSKKVFTVKETESIDKVLPKMEKKEIRHLPVVNKDGICTGMLGARDLMGSMLNKIENENKIMVEYLLAVSRVAIVIMELASEKGINKDKRIVIKHKLTKSQLETITDTSRSTLNKIFANFQEEGIITFSKNEIVLINKQKLNKKII